MVRMILAIAGVAVVAAAMLGSRGQKTTNRPRHIFWDMKYQGKYSAQAASRFFADGRTARLPVTNTVAFSGSDYFTDAGYLKNGYADFLKEDDSYYLGYKGTVTEDVPVTVPKLGADGKPEMKDGKPVMENKTEKQTRNNWTERIPQRVVDEMGGWDKLITRGKERYTINCSVCHGATGLGGQGDTAHGILGKYGMVGIASYHQDRLREMADGEIYNTINVGKNTMSPYGHQVKPADRWAIVAYVRVLQYAQLADKTAVPTAQLAEWGIK
jgi:mono/diheme cytochrome c family protein